MGPEWQRSQLRDMTKAGKREKKVESRKQKRKQWNRDERGLCGDWFKRKFLVYFLFALCVVCVHYTQSLAITVLIHRYAESASFLQLPFHAFRLSHLMSDKPSPMPLARSIGPYLSSSPGHQPTFPSPHSRPSRLTQLPYYPDTTEL